MDGDRPRLRLATPDDADGIARVHIASWRAAYPGIIPQPMLDGLEHGPRAERWRQILAEGRSVVRVALFGDEVGAFGGQGPPRDDDLGPEVLEISALYAHPDRWRSGAGRMLVEAARNDAARAKQHEISLWVLEANERAIRFYEAMGFRPDGARKLDFGDWEIPELRLRARVPG